MDSKQKHLWEVDHAYYCSEGNYSEDIDTWQAFVEEYGQMDRDYNLVFRWDWKRADDPDNELERDCLMLFWVQQRKGALASVNVSVNEEDEPAVIAWLQPRLLYLIDLWQPTPAPSESGELAALRDQLAAAQDENAKLRAALAGEE